MAKKTFKDTPAFNENPALMFISKTDEKPAEREAPEGQTEAKAPEGYHLNPLYIENKSRRLQLLVKPSTVEKLRARAKAEGTSVNDIVNTILEGALGEE